jgi:hypothetical protein
MTGNANGSRWFFAHDRLASPNSSRIRSRSPGTTLSGAANWETASASRFLSDVIETMIRRGQRSRLALSNRAISAYQRFRSSVPQDQNGRVLPPVVSAIPARNTRITGTILGSWPSEVRIPIYSGRVFRREAGHRSDLKPATIPK